MNPPTLELISHASPLKNTGFYPNEKFCLSRGLMVQTASTDRTNLLLTFRNVNLIKSFQRTTILHWIPQNTNKNEYFAARCTSLITASEMTNHTRIVDGNIGQK